MSIAAKGCVHSKRWQSIELRDQRLICENWIWLACQASPLGNLGFVSKLFNVHLKLQKHNVFLTTGLHISCIPLTGFNLPFPHRPGWIVDFEGQNGDSDPRRTGHSWPSHCVLRKVRGTKSRWRHHSIVLSESTRLPRKLSLHKQRCNVFRRLRGGMFDGPQSIPPHCQKHQKPPDVFTKIVSSHELLMLPSSQLSRSTSATEPCTCSDNR